MSRKTGSSVFWLDDPDDEYTADGRWKEVVFTAKQAQDGLEATNGGGGEYIPQGAAYKTNKATPKPGLATSIPRLGRAATMEATAPLPEEFTSSLARPAHLPPGFCDECFVPVPDDPDPEKLFIYLHALRYTTPRLGSWSTPLPRWAEDNWGGDWRGWSDQAVPEMFGDEPEAEVEAESEAKPGAEEEVGLMDTETSQEKASVEQ